MLESPLGMQRGFLKKVTYSRSVDLPSKAHSVEQFVLLQKICWLEFDDLLSSRILSSRRLTFYSAMSVSKTNSWPVLRLHRRSIWRHKIDESAPSRRMPVIVEMKRKLCKNDSNDISLKTDEYKKEWPKKMMMKNSHVFIRWSSE